MPHIIISCFSLNRSSEWFDKVVNKAHAAILNTDLFDEQSIKIRLASFEFGSFGGNATPYIHTEVRLLPGKTAEQLSKVSEKLMHAIYEECSKGVEVSVEVALIEKSYLNNSRHVKN